MTRSTQTSAEGVKAGELTVAPQLKRFVDHELLPGTGIEPESFWAGLARLVAEFTPRNRELLEVREQLQSEIDDWHRRRRGELHDSDAYEGLLWEIGYLQHEGEPFTVDTKHVDLEIGAVAGPQLVVPVTNARYAINAANARWGSLYDALYGTDALGELPEPGPYDPQRGDEVIAWGRSFLDEIFPLREASHADSVRYAVSGGRLNVVLSDGRQTGLVDDEQFAGSVGPGNEPSRVLLRNNGLHVELLIDRAHAVGQNDPAGIADLVIEAAVSVIMDCEDSVATVRVDDKVLAYRHWLGLMRGELETEVHKSGDTFTRVMADDREYAGRDGAPLTLPGRGLMLVRNVGHLMTTDAVRDNEGEPVFEGIVDAAITVACAMHDLKENGALRNSRQGSVYVVKPKMHGPAEVAFADQLFGGVEDMLGLPRNTVKLGLMDEERRTSANLAECIRAIKSRIAFINTGFLDRTGDEIHTSMEAGPMVRKDAMKNEPWMTAYEERNVSVGLACGLRGVGQIGKGMWAAPDRMAAMLREKVAHPQAGATCAWVPSPTAATLHATHYHRVDVHERQSELMEGDSPAPLSDLLTIPASAAGTWSESDVAEELQNNAQGILGYVVRWVDQGVGCSKVPDVRGVALMEDRATCRISSQHMANWLRHGIVSEHEVVEVMEAMAVLVDEQNALDPGYEPMAPTYDGPAFRAALDLVLQGTQQPSGYTEPILYSWRAERLGLMGEPESSS